MAEGTETKSVNSSEASKTKPVDRDPYGIKRFLSGGVGGMCLVAVGHPFDTTKVKLQTSNEYKSTMDAVRSIYLKEGIKGFYRGMLTPLVFVTPMYAVCFWGYDLGQKLVRYGQKIPADEPLNLFQISFAGGFSAIPTTALMTPIERIKVLLQTQKPDAVTGKLPFKGPADVATHLVRTGGIQSLYRGTIATLVRDVPGSVAYFGMYEYVKKTFSKPGELNKGAVLFAGGMAGVANWTVSIPPDVLKSRLQAAPEGTYKGLGDVFVKMMAEEGPTALFKGIGPIMARAFPANAATFFGAEISYKFLDTVM
jgi:solute carrier family 25 (mitochondrial carnitine/acylcarnitine transporter), member 20/29